MTVLVTGGAGYIGSHMVHELVDAGDPVVVLDNLSTGFRYLIPASVPFVSGSTGDRELVAKVIEQYGVTAIIHFAASIVVPDSLRDPLGYYHNNTMNTCALLDTAIESGVRQFIFSSTAAVYGNADAPSLREDAPTVPISPYGTSKLMSEIMLHDAGRAHGLRFVILRYFNVAGADPRGRTGQSSPGATHLIKVACEAAIGKRPKMSVYGTDYDTPDGTGIRDYIHVSDLARAQRFRVRSDRRRAPRQRPGFPGRNRRPPPRRSGGFGRQCRAYSQHLAVAAAVSGHRHHRRPCFGVGKTPRRQAWRRPGLTRHNQCPTQGG
jgi:UDP-glucose 4-epimerase